MISSSNPPKTPSMPQSDIREIDLTDLGYDLEDFRASYRKYHDGREPQTAFVVDLMAMQAAILAEADQLITNHTKAATIELEEELKAAKDNLK